MRMASLTAAIAGAHAADCLADVVIGRPPRRLSFAYSGQGIALGRHEAVGFNNFPDDAPKWPVFRAGLASEVEISSSTSLPTCRALSADCRACVSGRAGAA